VALVESGAPVTFARLLHLAADDGRAATRVNVAEALVEARVADAAAALPVIREWASSDDAERRWPAICSLLLWRKQSDDERERDLAAFLSWDAATTASVLVEILNHGRQKPGAVRRSLERLVPGADGATRRAFVSGLAALPEENLEERLLPLLRASEEPSLAGLAAEVRAERWRAMLPAPAEFLADLRGASEREGLGPEVYTALARMAEHGPDGCRAELTHALVTCFVEGRAALEDAMTKLTRLGPATFGPLFVEVRRAGLSSLLYDAPSFVRAAAEGLSRPESAAETREALELLSPPEPRGGREAVLQALAAAQEADAAAARTLLQLFRQSGSGALGELAYECSLRSLGGDLADPEVFLSRVTAATRDALERAEVFEVLRQLSAPEPPGRRSSLVRALGALRATRRAEVDALLSEQSWQSAGGLLGLGAKVKLFSFLSNHLSPGVAAAILAPRP